jgi:hypothetical protein
LNKQKIIARSPGDCDNKSAVMNDLVSDVTFNTNESVDRWGDMEMDAENPSRPNFPARSESKSG